MNLLGNISFVNTNCRLFIDSSEVNAKWKPNCFYPITPAAKIKQSYDNERLLENIQRFKNDYISISLQFGYRKFEASCVSVTVQIEKSFYQKKIGHNAAPERNNGLFPSGATRRYSSAATKYITRSYQKFCQSDGQKWSGKSVMLKSKRENLVKYK